MYQLLTKRVWTSQPYGIQGVDTSNPLTRGLVFCHYGPKFFPVLPTNHGLAFDNPSFTAGPRGKSLAYNGSSVDFKLSVAATGTNPAAATMFAFAQTNQTAAAGTVISQGQTVSDNPLFRVFQNVSPSQWAIQYRDDAATLISVNGATAAVVGVPAFLVSAFRSGAGEKSLWVNGVKVVSNTTSLGSITLTNTSVGMLKRTAETQYFGGQIPLAGIYNRALSDMEIVALSINPWQLFRPKARQLWKGFVPVGIAPVGGGSNSLHALTDSGGGSIGLAGGGFDILKAPTDSGGGTVTSGADVGGGLDTLRALRSLGGGNIGVMGSGLDTLQPLQDSGGGTNASPDIIPPTPGGAPAWWGYEGFDGTRRPWWYRDLKDKAAELERQRKIRVEMGILPAVENKRIKKVVKQVEAFVEEIPEPNRSSADYYIARQEEISARIDALIDRLEEDDDEQVIMEMSKFFFHRKVQEQRQWSH